MVILNLKTNISEDNMYSDLIFDYLKDVYAESGEDLGFDRQSFELGITRERYDIVTIEESEKYNKPKGRYELLSIPDILMCNANEIEYITDRLACVLKEIVGDIGNKNRILIVGLGNRHISSDSLGAKVVGKINITIKNKNLPKVMAISPSVMGLTGIETVDIVEGVVLKTKPTHVIIIDSLCASSATRLGRSLQVTNTGICPGGGVGNQRKCIDKKVAPNVFSIGVPLLIYASTFVSDSLEKNGINQDEISGIMQTILKHNELSHLFKFFKNISNVYKDNVDNMIVSLKDIEEVVELLSNVIANAINRVLGVGDING